MTNNRFLGENSKSTDSLSGLERIEAAIADNPALRPVWEWHPENVGRIDIHISADGSWHYLSSPIARERLVKLFASILRLEEDGQHYLVTPAEKLAISVEDAAFLAIHMDAAGEGRAQVLGFRTNVDDYVKVDGAHPLRFAKDADTGGVKPYICVRDGLEALVNRPVTYDLMELATVHEVDGTQWFGVWSNDIFFSIAPQSEIA